MPAQATLFSTIAGTLALIFAPNGTKLIHRLRSNSLSTEVRRLPAYGT